VGRSLIFAGVEEGVQRSHSIREGKGGFSAQIILRKKGWRYIFTKDKEKNEGHKEAWIGKKRRAKDEEKRGKPLIIVHQEALLSHPHNIYLKGQNMRG